MSCTDMTFSTVYPGNMAAVYWELTTVFSLYIYYLLQHILHDTMYTPTITRSINTDSGFWDFLTEILFLPKYLWLVNWRIRRWLFGTGLICVSAICSYLAQIYYILRDLSITQCHMGRTIGHWWLLWRWARSVTSGRYWL